MRLVLVSLVATCLVACAIPDAVIRHPLTGGGVADNRIIKPHPMEENGNGLPRGSLNDEASLTEMTRERTCFDIIVHELKPVDLQNATCKLKTSGMKSIPNPQLWPEQATVQGIEGLVPQRYYAGQQTYCSYYGRYGCLVWSTRPYYATRMVPGTINVFASRARMCFATGAHVNQETKHLILEVSVPRSGDLFPKNVSFTWELSGAVKR